MKNREYHYGDVSILPNFSRVCSRGDVSVSVKLVHTGLSVDVPVFMSPMDTVCNLESSRQMFKFGAIPTIHRFLSPDNQKKLFESLFGNCFDSVSGLDYCAVALGLNDYKERVELIEPVGAPLIYILDVANGGNANVQEALRWLSSNFPDREIMAGNVVTSDCAKFLEDCGATLIRAGIAGGSACMTKNVTGIFRPYVSMLEDLHANCKRQIVADGSIKEPQDACKAFYFGASFVMAGGIFSGCAETGTVYRGMASRETLHFHSLFGKNRPEYSEGRQIKVEPKMILDLTSNPKKPKYRKKTVGDVINEYVTGIKSSLSYCGYDSLSDAIGKANSSEIRTVLI